MHTRIPRPKRVAPTRLVPNTINYIKGKSVVDLVGAIREPPLLSILASALKLLSMLRVHNPTMPGSCLVQGGNALAILSGLNPGRLR